MRWTVKENFVSPCPGLSLTDLPDRLPANMHILHSNGVLSISSENIAGVLPCKNGHEIIIEPKYSSIKPIEILLYINNISGIAVNRERLQKGDKEISLQTIADAFVGQLNLIKANARKFQRIACNTVTKAVVGKVNWVKTYRMQQQGRTDAIYTTTRVATYDIPENILIAAAAKKIISLYPSSSTEFEILLPWVKIGEYSKHSYNELYSLQLRMNERTLSGAHAFYYAPVMLSKIILGFMGAETVNENDDTILFNMPGLYENYVRTGFQRVGSKHGCSIQKGLIPRSFLFFNGECEMIPDITIYDGATIKTLLDVKYKVPDSKDYYQIFAYMKYAHIDTAYIISPAVEHNQTITAFDGSKITYVRIDNSNPETLEKTAERIIRDVM